MCSLCYPEDFFSGLHKDTGIHASSIPTSARLIFHMEIQQVRKQLVIRGRRAWKGLFYARHGPFWMRRARKTF